MLLRLTGMKRRPGPTSTRWIVALANRTVAPVETGRRMGELGGDVVAVSGELTPADEVGVSGDPFGLLGCCCCGESGLGGNAIVCLGGGLVPSGLVTRRMPFGFGVMGRELTLEGRSGVLRGPD